MSNEQPTGHEVRAQLDGEWEIGHVGLPTMSPERFRDLGYLQEVNRQFLHPLGLALAVVTEEDGTTRFEMQDVRFDPEGMLFAECRTEEEYADMVTKAQRVAEEMAGRRRYRLLLRIDRIQALESLKPPPAPEAAGGPS